MAGTTEDRGDELRPSVKLKSLYYTYFTAFLFVGILSWYVPVLLFAPLEVPMAMAIIILPILLFTLYWIPKFFGTIRYRLTRSEMEWRRGVWFRQTGIVPYNRITNIDISQGPVSRHFGIASLKIQTAGYSGSTTKTSEIAIEGVEHFEELREFIMGMVRGGKPVAVETYGKGEGSDVLGELVKIRKLLEKKR